MIFRKIILHICNHLFVSKSKVMGIHSMHVWFGVNDKNVFQVNSCVIICNSIIFSISQTTNKRHSFLRKEFLNFIHQVCLDVSCLFEDFFFNSGQELLRFSNECSWNAYCILNIFFGKFIHRKTTHRDPYNFVTIRSNFSNQFCITLMQKIFIHRIAEQSTNVISS